MTEIRFYHLQTQTMEQALPQLLQKAYGGKKKVVVKAPSSEMVEIMNVHLWTYEPDSFLPHGSQKDGHAAQQPIWLTDKDENPNQADTLMLAGTLACGIIDQFELCCILFDGRDEEQISQTRILWKKLKNSGYPLTYWQQSPHGKWELKS